MAGSAVPVAMHWLISWLALRGHQLGTAIKVHTLLLVRDGQLDEEILRKVHVSERDLWRTCAATAWRTSAGWPRRGWSAAAS